MINNLLLNKEIMAMARNNDYSQKYPNRKRLEQILQKGANINYEEYLPGYGMTNALMVAITAKNEDMALLLVRNGIEFDQYFGNTTPIKAAFKNELKALFAVLLTESVERNRVNHLVSLFEDGIVSTTTLKDGKEEIVPNSELITKLLKIKDIETAVDNGGNNVLHKVVTLYGVNEQLTKELINNGSDVNSRNNEGNTPLHDAAEALNSEEFLSIAKTLVDHGAYAFIPNIDSKTAKDIFEKHATTTEKQQFENIISAQKSMTSK